MTESRPKEVPESAKLMDFEGQTRIRVYSAQGIPTREIVRYWAWDDNGEPKHWTESVEPTEEELAELDKEFLFTSDGRNRNVTFGEYRKQQVGA